MMTDIKDTIRLARAFGEQVQTLSVAEFREIILRNKSETNDGICHSHDFCDANMLMLDAFIETFGRNPLDGPDGMTDEDGKLWDGAWAIAKAAEFFA